MDFIFLARRESQWDRINYILFICCFCNQNFANKASERYRIKSLALSLNIWQFANNDWMLQIERGTLISEGKILNSLDFTKGQLRKGNISLVLLSMSDSFKEHRRSSWQTVSSIYYLCIISHPLHSAGLYGSSSSAEMLHSFSRVKGVCVQQWHSDTSVVTSG